MKASITVTLTLVQFQGCSAHFEEAPQTEEFQSRSALSYGMYQLDGKIAKCAESAANVLLSPFVAPETASFPHLYARLLFMHEAYLEACQGPTRA
jgi:hypothetical protein